VFLTNTGSLVIIILSIWNQLTNQSINTCQDEPFPLSVKACIETGNKT
jgi:hypothetical protein